MRLTTSFLLKPDDGGHGQPIRPEGEYDIVGFCWPALKPIGCGRHRSSAEATEFAAFGKAMRSLPLPLFALLV